MHGGGGGRGKPSAAARVGLFCVGCSYIQIPAVSTSESLRTEPMPYDQAAQSSGSDTRPPAAKKGGRSHFSFGAEGQRVRQLDLWDSVLQIR